MKKRTLFGILCIVLAAVISCVAIPLLLKKSNQRMQIVRVIMEIPKGEIITEDKLELTEVGSYGLPEYVATSYDQIVGKYALTDLCPGDYFLPEKVSSSAAVTEYDAMENGMVAVTMAIPSLSSSVANTLRAGDIVSICQFKDGETTQNEALHYVKIIALSNADGVNLENVTEEQSPVAATVTFAVTEAQAKEIINIDHQSGMHLIFVCRGDDARADALLMEQRNAFEEDAR